MGASGWSYFVRYRREVELFGTDQPTHEMLERWSQRVDPLVAEPLYNRWEGIYIVVYKGGQPDEIYFEGCSGD